MAKTRSKTATKTPTSKKFKSKFEGAVALALDKMGAHYEYEPHTITYTVERAYHPDFVLDNGIHVETKGWFKSEDQRKMRAVRDQNPSLDIRFVFQKLSGKCQGSNMTNEEWCLKYNFKYAEGTIPKEWIRERKKN